MVSEEIIVRCRRIFGIKRHTKAQLLEVLRIMTAISGLLCDGKQLMLYLNSRKKYYDKQKKQRINLSIYYEAQIHLYLSIG